MAERYDLVVVGAGPGGSSAAYHSAKAGLNTLLIDRQEFPRDKTCGDGLMPHAASEVALMGLADWLDEPHHGKFTGFSMYTRTAHLRQNGLRRKAPGDRWKAPRTRHLGRRSFPFRIEGHGSRAYPFRAGSRYRSREGRGFSALRSPPSNRGRRCRGIRGTRAEGPPECRRPQTIF
jgi:choline dehydrogenase-like flavoprotein